MEGDSKTSGQRKKANVSVKVKSVTDIEDARVIHLVKYAFAFSAQNLTSNEMFSRTVANLSSFDAFTKYVRSLDHKRFYWIQQLIDPKVLV